MLQYVASFRDRLQTACDLVRSNLQMAQRKMKAQYDKKAVECTFEVGDTVLVLLPMCREKLGVKYYGPYMVSKRIGKCNYVIDTPDRRKKSRLCHINLLKPYDTRAPQSTVCLVPRVEVGEEENEDDGVGSVEPVTARLDNSSALVNLEVSLSHLTTKQREDVTDCLEIPWA